jgi:polyhydroxybutyrate depolymerase
MVRKSAVRGLSIIAGVLVGVVVIATTAIRILDESSGTIASSGENRPYLLHVPASYDGTRDVPLVISLHAAAMWPAQQRNLSRWDQLASENGFLVLFPSGRKVPKIWPDAVGTSDGRDVQFIADLIDTVSARYKVDPARVYLNGMSNGAGLATVASCALSERIAAVGLVAAVQVMPQGTCAAVRPVPVIAFHGDADRMAPYDGGPVGDPFNPAKPSVPAVRDWVRDLARRNRCPDDVSESQHSEDISRLEYNGCAEGAAVVLYTVVGGGHTWPGGKPLPRWLAGSTVMSIDATKDMWAFFRGHSLH